MAKAARYQNVRGSGLQQVDLTTGKPISSAKKNNQSSVIFGGGPADNTAWGIPIDKNGYSITIDGKEQTGLSQGQYEDAMGLNRGGSEPTVVSNIKILEDLIPSLNARANAMPTFGADNNAAAASFGEEETNSDDIFGLGDQKKKKKKSWDEYQNREGTNQALPAGYWEGMYGPEADYFKRLADIERRGDWDEREAARTVKQQFARRKKEQENINRGAENQMRQALLTAGDDIGGSSRYAPLSSAGLMSAQETVGLQKLLDLDDQERIAVASAKMAQKSENYQQLQEEITRYKEIKEEKATALKEIQETQIQASRDSAVAGLLQQGITNPIEILQALNKTGGDFTAKEVNEAITNLTSSDNPLDALLSVEESKKLGVPFGTTKREAFGMSVKTSDLDNMTPAQQSAMFKLADDYQAQSKEFFTVQNAYERVKSSAKNPSAAGDLALIFSFMKMLDPTSVVREQEFANAQNAAGVPERIRAAYNNALRGERLTTNTRADFLSQAKSQWDAQKNLQEKRNETFGQRSQMLGINPSYVIQSLDTDETRPAEERLQELYNSDPQAQVLIEEIMTNEPDVSAEDLLDLISKGPVSMQAERLADAIAMTETGNKQVRGASGEFGAFQFLPTTWAKISIETSGKLLPQTPENERRVATEKIKQLLTLGKTPEEIALIWNTSLGGTEEPRRIAGTNKSGVKYDSVAYAQKVLKNMNS